MPHHPEPFYRSARKGWFIQLGKRQVPLGRDPEPKTDRKTGKPIAPAPVLAAYHEIMAGVEEPQPTPVVEVIYVVVVIDNFLAWVERHKSKRTYEWYQRHCQSFARSIPRALPVTKLKPMHLTNLCDAHPDWSPTTKHGLCRAVQRAFNWAERQGIIDRTPLAGVEKPQPQDRDVVVSPEEYRQVIGMVSGGFKDLLEMAWESGIRPQVIRIVEARHLDFPNGRIVFAVKESKGKKLPRVVYLPDEALRLARSLAVKHPQGPIFRNADGVPWTRYAINCAFIRLQKKLGRKLHLGAFRKSWATEAMKNGVDPITAAHLLGHSNPSMLAKVYAKMQHDPVYMREQAKKAKG